jgi:hypothetical protein
MDVPRFWDLVIAAIHAADRVSPLNGGSGGGNVSGGNAAAPVAPHRLPGLS